MSHRLLVDIFRSLNSEGLPSEDVSVQHPSATRPILHGSKIDRVTRTTAQIKVKLIVALLKMQQSERL